MSSTQAPDAGTGRARRDSVADLVYTSFRRRVYNPKHLFFLFPPDYRRQVVQFDPGEEHRTNMFKRRNSLRSSTRSEGGSRTKWGRRKQSVADVTPDVTSPLVNDGPSERKITRGRSQSVPMVKLEPDADGAPSPLQVRRSSNAYLELMWPRFFGSNRDIHEASQRTIGRRHSEVPTPHSRHSSGGGGSAGHSRHNSGGGSNSSRHNSDSMTVLEEEGGLHDSGIHGGSSRGSLTSMTSVGDVFLDDIITPASSTHSLHKPEVEMRLRAASQSYLQHKATHPSQGPASHKPTSDSRDSEQILSPQALLQSNSITGEAHEVPQRRPSSYSGIENKKEKQTLLNLSRLSTGSRLGDELVGWESGGKNDAARPKSDAELRYEDVLDHLMWDVDVPDTATAANPATEQLTTKPSSITEQLTERPSPNPITEKLTATDPSSGLDDHALTLGRAYLNNDQTQSDIQENNAARGNNNDGKYGITTDNKIDAELSEPGTTNDARTRHGDTTKDVINNDVINKDVSAPVSSNQPRENMPYHQYAMQVDKRRKAFGQSRSKYSQMTVEPPKSHNVLEPFSDTKAKELNSTPNITPSGTSMIEDSHGRRKDQLPQSSTSYHDQPYVQLEVQKTTSALNQEAIKYNQNTVFSGASGHDSRLETHLDELSPSATLKDTHDRNSKQDYPSGMDPAMSMELADQWGDTPLEANIMAQEAASVINQSSSNTTPSGSKIEYSHGIGQEQIAQGLTNYYNQRYVEPEVQKAASALNQEAMKYNQTTMDFPGASGFDSKLETYLDELSPPATSKDTCDRYSKQGYPSGMDTAMSMGLVDQWGDTQLEPNIIAQGAASVMNQSPHITSLGSSNIGESHGRGQEQTARRSSYDQPYVELEVQKATSALSQEGIKYNQTTTVESPGASAHDNTLERHLDELPPHATLKGNNDEYSKLADPSGMSAARSMGLVDQWGDTNLEPDIIAPEPASNLNQSPNITSVSSTMIEDSHRGRQEEPDQSSTNYHDQTYVEPQVQKATSAWSQKGIKYNQTTTVDSPGASAHDSTLERHLDELSPHAILKGDLSGMSAARSMGLIDQWGRTNLEPDIIAPEPASTLNQSPNITSVSSSMIEDNHGGRQGEPNQRSTNYHDQPYVEPQDQKTTLALSHEGMKYIQNTVDLPVTSGHDSTLETHLDELSPHAILKGNSDEHSKQSDPSEINAARSIELVDQWRDTHLEPNITGSRPTSVLNQVPNVTSSGSAKVGYSNGKREEQVARTSTEYDDQPYFDAQRQGAVSSVNQEGMKYPQSSVDLPGTSGLGSKRETNLDELPVNATSKDLNDTHSQQPQLMGMNSARSMEQLEQREELLTSSHPPMAKSRMTGQEKKHPLLSKSSMGERDLNPSTHSRRLSSSSLDGDLLTSTRSFTRVDQLIPDPWYSRYSDSSLNLLDVTPRPPGGSEETGGTTSTDSEAAMDGGVNFDASDYSKAPRDSASSMTAGTTQANDFFQDKDGQVGMVHQQTNNAEGTGAGNSGSDVSDYHQRATTATGGPMQTGDNQGRENLLRDNHGPLVEGPSRNSMEIGAAKMRSNSDAGRGKIHMNPSDNQHTTRGGNCDQTMHKNNQGQALTKGETFEHIPEVDKGEGLEINIDFDGDKERHVMGNTKVGRDQEGYLEEVYMGDDGPGAMLQATNKPNVHNYKMSNLQAMDNPNLSKDGLNNAQAMNSPSFSSERKGNVQAMNNPNLNSNSINNDQSVNNSNLTVDRMSNKQVMNNPNLNSDRISNVQAINGPNLSKEIIDNVETMNNSNINSDRIDNIHNNSNHYNGYDGSDALKTLIGFDNVANNDDKDDTVYTYTSVVEWKKDNTPSSPDTPKPDNDEGSTTYTFSSKVEWNKQSQSSEDREPLLAAEGASVVEGGQEEGEAHLEAYLHDAIKRHSSIVLETEADSEFLTGKSSLRASDDRIRRQTSVGVHANPGTQFSTRDNDDGDDDNIRSISNLDDNARLGPRSTSAKKRNLHSHGQMERCNALEENIPRQINVGVHATRGPRAQRDDLDDLPIPSLGDIKKWKSRNDSEEEKQDSGITEKWTLLSQGHAENTKVTSRSKGYGALQSGDYQDCRVRKGSVKLEKLKTKKMFTFCCFPFEFYW